MRCVKNSFLLCSRIFPSLWKVFWVSTPPPIWNFQWSFMRSVWIFPVIPCYLLNKWIPFCFACGQVFREFIEAWTPGKLTVCENSFTWLGYLNIPTNLFCLRAHPHWLSWAPRCTTHFCPPVQTLNATHGVWDVLLGIQPTRSHSFYIIIHVASCLFTVLQNYGICLGSHPWLLVVTCL